MVTFPNVQTLSDRNKATGRPNCNASFQLAGETAMPNQVDEQAILKQAIADLDPQVPIRSWRRNDNVITLYLADGRAIAYDWKQRQALAEGVTVYAGDLNELNKDALMQIAQDVDLPGRSTMTKADLVEALEELRS